MQTWYFQGIGDYFQLLKAENLCLDNAIQAISTRQGALSRPASEQFFDFQQ